MLSQLQVEQWLAYIRKIEISLQAQIDSLGPGSAGTRGPSGMDGQDGEDGLSGFPGPQGPTGATGSAGATGASGLAIPGADGEDGLDGFSIVGPIGATGATGAAGFALDGEDGQDGAAIVGPQGLQGPQGLLGMTGNDGEDGMDGMSILNTNPLGLQQYYSNGNLVAPVRTTLDRTGDENIATSVNDSPSTSKVTVNVSLIDLDMRFRRLLAYVVNTFGEVPPGLEDETERAFQEQI